MRRALMVSAALHFGALVAVLGGTGWLAWIAAPPPPQQAVAEMVFVDPGQDRPAAPQSPPPTPTPTPTSAPDPAPKPAASASPPQAAAPPFPPPPNAATDPPPAPSMARTGAAAQATEQQPEPPRPAAEPPQVRLGGDPGMTDEVESRDVPVGPDPAARNIPPRYPIDAARDRLQGTVNLLVDVGPNGAAAAVRVFESSGVASLDRAALEAVARWHFRSKLPGASADGAQTLIQVRFRLD